MEDEGLVLLTVGTAHYHRGTRWQELETPLKAFIFRKKSNECLYLALSLLLISLRPKPEIGATSGDDEASHLTQS